MEKNIKFLSEPIPDHLCPISFDPLTEPYLTDCGHHCCYRCRQHLLTSSKTGCPVCCELNVLTNAHLNKHLQRQVYSLKVRCQHHEVGCQWVRDLKLLQEHLDPEKRKCSFILLTCPFGCGKRVRNSAMKDHILSDCCKRLYMCEHCSYCNKFDIVTEQHYPLCEMFPVECPNNCSMENLKRLELVSHLEQCTLQVIQCPFASAGCTVQLPRREMEEHEKDPEVMHQHLRMMMSTLQLKPTSEEPAAVSVSTNLSGLLVNLRRMLHIKQKSKEPAVSKHSEYLVNLPPVEFAITDFMRLKECNAEWVSPPFYTHPQGYKLCIVVYPNGKSYANGRYVSIVAGFLYGEHDVSLTWPLEADVVVELLNWKKDKDHCKRTIVFYSNRNYQVSPGGIKMSPIFNEFISHSSLFYNSTTNTEYLQNDCVRLRVNKVILYSTALLNKTPSWQNSHNGYQSLHEFTLTDFSKRMQFSNRFYSSPFYTHHHGCKFCLEVYCNGDSIGRLVNTKVSVYLTLMAGKYDDHLEWPFVGKFDIELLNWDENADHHKMELSIVPSNKFTKVECSDCSLKITGIC